MLTPPDTYAVFLDVVGVSVNSKNLLQNIQLSFPDRGLVAVIGPNGAGKSSLLKTILGVLPCNTGKVYIQGRELGEWPANELAKHWGYVAQQANSDWDLYVEELLNINPARKTPAYLSLPFELGIFCHRRLNSLSGGEKARVMLARAMLHQPKLLMVDEADAHLDLPYQRQVMELLHAYSRDACVITILHDLTCAARYADLIVLMGQGCIEHIGSVEETLTSEKLTQAYDAPLEVISYAGNLFVR
ncbi:MAG: ABC transporter ATP-binding protein [Burkholderiales bacterium]|jgi:iron complex transport system ATP-binding protein|nr:ABC transporter ATP-binding protein [Burkholderiales bacterium]